MAGITLRRLVEMFLAHCERTKSPRTRQLYGLHLKDCARVLNEIEPQHLRRANVESWLDSRPQWGRSSRAAAITALQACLNWAVYEYHLDHNPLKGHLHKPRARSRGREWVISKEEYQLLQQHSSTDFASFLAVLWETGARPDTVCRVTSADYNREGKCWILQQHKSSRYGHDLIVRLSRAAIAATERALQENPTGPLFRRLNGEPWTVNHACSRMKYLQQKLHLRRGISLYSFRHTFATNLLAAGVPDATVSSLLGHRGTRQLHEHYSHICNEGIVLSAALYLVR